MSRQSIRRSDVNRLMRFLKKNPVLAAVIILVAAGAIIYSALSGGAAEPMDGLYVHYIDIGQGDAELICCGGKYMLIDGGESSEEDTLVSYLKNEGVERLEYIVCTHAHSDHCGGLGAVMQAFDVGTVFTSPYTGDSSAYARFLDAAADCSLEPEAPDFNAAYSLGEASFRFIGPLEEYSDQNDNSLVVRLEYGSDSFLFTGDMTTKAEGDLLDAGVNVKCDVLKVGHHGSSGSTGYHFLYEAEPDIAVISCGRDNSYGHPHEEALSRLNDADCTVYRTDELGSVVLFSDGVSISKV